MVMVPPMDARTTWARATFRCVRSAAASSASWPVEYTGSPGRSVSPTPRLSKVTTVKCGASALAWRAQLAAGADNPLISSTGSPLPPTSNCIRMLLMMAKGLVAA
jgi:hypothetical protein